MNGNGERWIGSNRELWVARVVMLALTIGLSVLIFLAFDPRQIWVHIYSHPVPVEPAVASRANIVDHPQLRAGELLWKWHEWCWTRDIQRGYVRRWISNDDKPESGVYSYAVATPASPKAGCYAKALAVPLPPEIPPGKYVMHTETDAPVNDLRTVVVTWPNVYFEVVP
jgi:hypothetical protein